MRVSSGSGSLTWLRLARPSAGASSNHSLRNPNPIKLAATAVSNRVVNTSGTLRQNLSTPAIPAHSAPPTTPTSIARISTKGPDAPMWAAARAAKLAPITS